MQWLLLWLVTFLTDVASLNMHGMLHTILHLEATKVFLCIAILQIHKASHYLCVGGSGLPFRSLDCELKQISFPFLNFSRSLPFNIGHRHPLLAEGILLCYSSSSFQ